MVGRAGRTESDPFDAAGIDKKGDFKRGLANEVGKGCCFEEAGLIHEG
jgi:hypothetical protein